MSKLSCSSISSSSTANVLCQCGVVVEMKISWTQSGRRFLCCKISKARVGCGYFRWCDDEMPAQSRRVIWGLLKRVKTYEPVAEPEISSRYQI
ncbi:hypothetical protein KY290_011198 [Solanum tuberosum]|uniref:GRF-type domain-containing protein n=1 Tax=Solanum tuberosum TaxID=4113 RepID=A0ABQ7W154_SOLTU|nr:hypothetical protein KY284_011218 [Solanum tuberosum]KAH0774061.1 hypothetical protein KY290_011198 [Solanum tuberosum]